MQKYNELMSNLDRCNLDYLDSLDLKIQYNGKSVIYWLCYKNCPIEFFEKYLKIGYFNGHELSVMLQKSTYIGFDVCSMFLKVNGKFLCNVKDSIGTTPLHRYCIHGNGVREYMELMMYTDVGLKLISGKTFYKMVSMYNQPNKITYKRALLSLIHRYNKVFKVNDFLMRRMGVIV